ncbi:hypothetical protein [Streptomyces olivochromogenes]|uniref:hypothetical protein n=1 Tax=Streptomyces olivochromogenes TaxID=1963 RepID=UPI0027E44BDB|nr:hypothetical protein [Streptomyces olivochromogenes]
MAGADIVLRRNRYDGLALMNESPSGPFWYTGGVNRAGAAGVTAGALCVNTVYTGPVAAALDGIDLSLPAGMIVAATVYGITMRHSDTVRRARASA